MLSNVLLNRLLEFKPSLRGLEVFAQPGVEYRLVAPPLTRTFFAGDSLGTRIGAMRRAALSLSGQGDITARVYPRVDPMYYSTSKERRWRSNFQWFSLAETSIG